ncbi:sodium- and chloride-dependent glycine transporter 1-like isoform X2 [Osmia bicornis bicornis]|uniref:sodium- and chloride-dependent glycine transporter 1-like isoform X2 n=1 Tax=Osmia bicornis bicornis TaxID=1437191 RepID=UPI001EAF1E5F|nr:sodium- and chloride-dependent glycine transporter 1-like isoform X2 [Osmia bicornis bicornis]
MTSVKENVPKVKRISLGVGGALVELAQDPERGSWANPIEFVLSCIGYAVGIGNVWRFPYLVYLNDGGIFLIPFILMLITMGLPIFFLELAIGQYSGLGPNEAFTRIAPAFQGVGYCTLVVILLVMVYYMVIVAWTLFYTFVSFMPKLKWAYCDNDFNTNDCYSGLQELECQQENPEMVFYNKGCALAKEVCQIYGFQGGNSTFCTDGDRVEPLRQLYKRVLSSEEYYNDYVLGLRGATWEHFGGIRWELLGCLTLAWIICFLCLMRGVQSIGKVVYFTALFPYVMLTALLIRGATLDGAGDGVIWFITFNWSRLGSTNIWGQAASQVFYSLGIGCGSLITLSSYSDFKNNCHRDAIFVTITNLLTSIFAGFVIFSIMGFLSKQMGLPISQVIKSGTGLAFIAYPEAVVRMPWPNVWAVLFFTMLFILGIGSQFAGVQAINTAILDLRPDLRKHESYVVLGICVTCWLLAIPMVFDGGIYLFTLMDWNTASWAILLIGIGEVGVVSWCYGCNKFLRNIAEMQMQFGLLLRGYWWLSWVVLAPITCLAVFVYQIYTYELPRYGEYTFPGWANAIGILIGLSTLAPMLFFFICRVWKGPRDWSLFRPAKTWGPTVGKNVDNETSLRLSVKNEQSSGEKRQEDCV